MSYWEEKSLAAMTDDEWEALCDGCGRCCLHKLENADTGEIRYTDVACRLLDTEACRCTRYELRAFLVRDCVRLAPDRPAILEWMPATCAYRTLHEGRPLPDWHPLVSGSPESVHEAGISVRGRCTSERFVATDEVEERVIDWIDVAT